MMQNTIILPTEHTLHVRWLATKSPHLFHHLRYRQVTATVCSKSTA